MSLQDKDFDGDAIPLLDDVSFDTDSGGDEVFDFDPAYDGDEEADGFGFGEDDFGFDDDIETEPAPTPKKTRKASTRAKKRPHLRVVDEDAVDLTEAVEDPTDPDITGEAPGIPLTDEHRELLVSSGISEAYLGLPHVQPYLRSVTSWDHVPERRHYGMREDAEPDAIWFGHPDPITGDVTWQLRPTHPSTDADGRTRKYLFREGAKPPIALRSAPMTLNARSKTVVVQEGTKQACALASVLRDQPNYVVLGISGCEGGMVPKANRLHPSIVEAIKDADDVIISLDGDAATKIGVYRAGERLGTAIKAHLRTRSARVRFVQITAGEDGKTGIDDLLAEMPEDERLAYVEGLFDGAITKPAPVRPRDKDGRAPSVSPEFYNRMEGGIMVESCAQHIVDNVPMALADLTDDLLVYEDNPASPRYGLHRVDRAAGASRYSRAVGKALVEMLGNRFSGSRVGDVEFIARALLEQEGRVVEDVFGDPQGHIPFRNGLYDPKTRTLKPFTPDVIITTKLLVNFNPEAKFEEIPAWIKRNTELDDGKHQMPQLLDALSSVFDALLGIPTERITVLFGESRSGKGTLVNDLILPMFDKAYTTGTGIVELAENNLLNNAELYGKLVSATGELPEHYIKDLSVLKKATGRDLIPADVKYKPHFDFVNRAAMIMAGNNPPNISDVTGAAQNRMTGIYYPRGHAGKEDLKLVETLTEEREGLAYALLQAWHERQDRGGTYLPSHPSAFRELTSRMNPLGGFVSECLRLPEKSDYIRKDELKVEFCSTITELFDFYEAYMRRVGRAKGVMARDNFILAIKRGFDVDQCRRQGDRGRALSVGINYRADMVRTLIESDTKGILEKHAQDQQARIVALTSSSTEIKSVGKKSAKGKEEKPTQ